MARDTLTIVNPVNENGGIAANAADISFVACNATNKSQFVFTGREIILVQNSGAGARTVTLTSAPDSQGRSGDITTYSLGAGEFALFGPFPLLGWQQSGGYFHLEGEHAEIKFCIVRLPAIQ